MREPVVETIYGKVRGILDNGIYTFMGIRYGADPGGENRFMPPRKPIPWSGIKDALKFGYSAPQSISARPLEIRPVSAPFLSYPVENDPYQTGQENEDCLFLNVWSAGLNDGKKRPVMFWLHGGGLSGLSASANKWNGANLARRGAVVVSINHRLGALGYTHLGDIGGSEYAHSGNAGMLDAIFALEWVRDNISQFGGDPNRVMIFGQSGGGYKVSMLLASPPAKGLFHSAIIQSGAGVRMVERDHGTMMAEYLLKALGLDKKRLSDIHNLPIEKIIAAQYAASAKLRGIKLPSVIRGFAPVLDSKILPAHPFYPEATSVSADVPVIIGYTRTESTFWSRFNLEAFNIDEAEMRESVKSVIGSDADNVIKIYRRNNPAASPAELNFLITTDYPNTGRAINIATRKAALDKASAYLFRFDWESPLDGGKLKSPHGAEIWFVFDNTGISPAANAGGEAARALAAKMSETWIAFARTGNPNALESGLPIWRPYDTTNHAMMLFNNRSECVNDPIREERIALDKIINRTPEMLWGIKGL